MANHCVKGLEIKVLNSSAGFYIGTFDDEEGPMCRLSRDYWKTKIEAQTALNYGSYVARDYAPEIQYCNGGCGCFGGM